MTIRKNFLLDDEIAQHLEELSKKQNLTQTQVIKNMIEEKYEEISIQEKLEILYDLVEDNKNNANPFLEQFAKDDHKILQKVKAMME